MGYVDGFVTAVPTANRDRFRASAAAAAPLFREFGVRRQVEAWGDDVPRGKRNDFWGAVQARDDETVVFSWLEYRDRAAREAAAAAMASDPRVAGLDMPFDGSRMIYSGFAPILDEGAARGSYVDGYVLPVSPARKADYLALAQTAAPVFRDHGALRVVECWGDAVTRGEVTDFPRAALAEADEAVVFSWIEWADKAARHAGLRAAMDDLRMATPGDMPFDGTRMIFGGFAVLFDEQGE